jgi:hypothetical protein
LKLIPEKLTSIPGQHLSPNCFVLLAAGVSKPQQRVVHIAQLDARSSKSLAYRQTKLHIGWMRFDNDAQTLEFQNVAVQSLFSRFKTRRPEFYLARTASLEAWPFGNILMVLVKPPNAQAENAAVFHIEITKVSQNPLSAARRAEPLPPPSL